MTTQLSLHYIIENENFSIEDQDNFDNQTDEVEPGLFEDTIYNMASFRAFFGCIYILTFVIGLFGNVLVCCVVFRNKHMQTVTNYFITNLALSDILLCTFAVPFTPLYIFLQEWVFGAFVCKAVPYAQGVSVYISAFTLMAIAIDRFFVILYPFQKRMSINTCLAIITIIWIAAAMLTLPYGVFMDLIQAKDGRWYCDEAWPNEESRPIFGLTTSVLQFVVPFVIIAFCYIRVCARLRVQARSLPGSKTARKEERTRRTNRMLISMVAIFGASWLPLNAYNVILDVHAAAAQWNVLNTFFILAHAVAMSSTCYNPIVYAYLNDNFRKEFVKVLPCLVSRALRNQNLSTSTKECNGQETVLENLIPCPENKLSKKEVIPNTTTTISFINVDNE